MKKVTKEEFINYINQYPHKLKQDQFPEYCHTWNDFSEGKVFPESIVARRISHEDNIEEFYIKNE